MPRAALLSLLLIGPLLGCSDDEPRELGGAQTGSTLSDTGSSVNDGSSGSGPGPHSGTSETGARPGSSSGATTTPDASTSAGSITTGDESTSTTGEPGDPAPTPGCGLAPGNVLGGVIDVDGQPRTYVLDLPAAYDPETPYPLVFYWHAAGADGSVPKDTQDVVGKWNEEVIVVYPDGLPIGNFQSGWDFNPDGRDFALFDALFGAIGTQLCIDQKRVFTMGHSFGGGMSNRVACHRGSIIRGLGVSAGSSISPSTDCDGPVAAFLVHGENDPTVSFSSGIAARDRWILENGCTSQTVEADHDACVTYEGCTTGYPVTWCVHQSGHMLQGWYVPEAVKFLRALEEP